MRPELRDQLVSLLGERVRFALPLARYTSFRIGGPADVVAEPTTLEELRMVKVLHDMELLRRGSRLSIQPVTLRQFNAIVALAKK